MPKPAKKKSSSEVPGSSAVAVLEPPPDTIPASREASETVWLWELED